MKIPRGVLALGIVSFLTDVSSEMVLPLIPIFVTSVLGAGTAVLGIIEGIADSTASFFEIFSGWLSDRYRKRKPVIIAGYSLSTVSKGLLTLANTWPLVLLARFGDRAGKGIRTAPRDALIASLAPKRIRGRAFGIHRALDTSGAIVGPLLSAGLILVLASQSIAAYQTIFAIAVIPSALAVGVLAFFVRERKPKAGKKFSLRFALHTLSPEFRRFLLVSIIFSLAYFSFAFLIIRAAGMGIGVESVLGLYVLFNVVYALASVPVGALSDRLGRRRVIAMEFALYALISAGFVFATDAWHAVALFALYGVFMSIDEVVVRAYVADMTEPRTRATAMGAYNTLTGIAYLPASVIAGISAQVFATTAAPFAIAAALAALAFVLFIIRR